MKRWILFVAALAIVSVGTWGVRAQQMTQKQEGAAHAQHQQAVYQCPMHPDVRASEPGKCPKCGMTLQKMPGMKGMTDMQHAGSPEQTQMQRMMARCRRMQMQARTGKNTPAALLSIREKLNLTDQQVGKLESIVQESRRKAEATLTVEQRKALAAIPEEPQSTMGMCARAMSTMGGGMGSEHPMMGTVQQGAAQQQPPTDEQGHQAHHDR